MDEMVGRVDKLDIEPAVDHWKAERPRPLARSCRRERPTTADVSPSLSPRTTASTEALDHELIRLAEPAIERAERVDRSTLPIRNVNRTVGTRCSHTR